MPLTQLAPPYPIFTDKNGDPLDAGYLYFGVANQNPETNPIQVYWDSALTQPAAQPIRTINGYPSRNGSPAAIYANVQFSVTVRNKHNDLVIYAPSGYGVTPGTTSSFTNQMMYEPNWTGAVSRNLTDRLEDYLSVADFGAVGDGVADDTVAIKAAIAQAEVNGGGVVYFPKQYYVVTETLEMPDGVVLKGRGVGSWDTVFHQRPKTWVGTNLLFKGTGASSYTVPGISSGEGTGGWREDPANPGTYFKLSSTMNSDASGATPATPKAFSVAIAPKVSGVSRHWGLSDIRIVPWIGTDGISEYSNMSYSSLADDWDIGVLMRDCEYVIMENVQVVGYWRAYGVALLNPDFTDFGAQERNAFKDCKFQGAVGLAIRAGDEWEVQAKTSSTVELYWTSESYWPASGLFTGLPAPVYTQYNYTSLSRSGLNLVFNGVTPDPDAAGLTTVRSPYRSSGAAGTYFLNVMSTGLDHVSGAKAETFGIANSKAIEISGFPLRGLQFFNYKAQTRENIISYFHKCEDTLFVNSQFEGDGSGVMIASPQSVVSTAPAPVGDTRGLRMLSTMISSADVTLFTPRSIHDDLRQYSPDTLSGEMQIKPLSGQDLDIFSASGKNVRFRNSVGATIARTTDAGNFVLEDGTQLNFVGNSPALINADSATASYRIRKNLVDVLTITSLASAVTPGADNTQNLGTSGLRWAEVFAAAPAINTSDANEKQDIRPITDAEKSVALSLKSKLSAFRFKDAVEKKGDGARIHFGVIAQDVQAAFQAEGLDGFSYGVLCYDTWWTDADGQVLEQHEDGAVEHGRFGVRYDELFAFILAAL